LSEDHIVIYITPFLDECKRVQDHTNRKFYQPDRKLGQGKKRNHLLSLIEQQKNIASTHALFADIDDEIIEHGAFASLGFCFKYVSLSCRLSLNF
jgi:hypothetical protein